MFRSRKVLWNSISPFKKKIAKQQTAIPGNGVRNVYLTVKSLSHVPTLPNTHTHNIASQSCCSLPSILKDLVPWQLLQRGKQGTETCFEKRQTRWPSQGKELHVLYVHLSCWHHQVSLYPPQMFVWHGSWLEVIIFQDLCSARPWSSRVLIKFNFYIFMKQCILLKELSYP